MTNNQLFLITTEQIIKFFCGDWTDVFLTKNKKRGYLDDAVSEWDHITKS